MDFVTFGDYRGIESRGRFMP